MYAFAINTSGASVLLLLLSSLLARGVDRCAGSPAQHPPQGFHRNRTGSAGPSLNPEHPLVTEPPTTEPHGLTKSLVKKSHSISFVHCRPQLKMLCNSWNTSWDHPSPWTAQKWHCAAQGTERSGNSESKKRLQLNHECVPQEADWQLGCDAMITECTTSTPATTERKQPSAWFPDWVVAERLSDTRSSGAAHE